MLTVRILQLVLLVIVLTGACARRPRGLSGSPQYALATRPCPSAADLRVAFLADSVKAHVDLMPSHAYVTYLMNGRIVAANMRSDSLAIYSRLYGPNPVDTLSSKSILTITPYRPGTAPSTFGICPGVVAIDIGTLPSP